MKRQLQNKRELMDKFMPIIEKMVEIGECVASLELVDDKQTVARFKRGYLEIRESLTNFTRDFIEPIRLGIKENKNVQQLPTCEKTDDGESRSEQSSTSEEGNVQ